MVQGIHSEWIYIDAAKNTKGLYLIMQVQILEYEMPALGFTDITLFDLCGRSACLLLFNLR